jgi:hexokinase
MTSGRYLGKLILLTLKKAASEGLLSDGDGASILALDDLPY